MTARPLAAALSVALALAVWPLGAALATEGQPAPIAVTSAGEIVTIPEAGQYALTYSGPGGYSLAFRAVAGSEWAEAPGVSCQGHSVTVEHGHYSEGVTLPCSGPWQVTVGAIGFTLTLTPPAPPPPTTTEAPAPELDGFGPPTEAEREAGNTGQTEDPTFYGPGEDVHRLRVILSGRSNGWIVERQVTLPPGDYRVRQYGDRSEYRIRGKGRCVAWTDAARRVTFTLAASGPCSGELTVSIRRPSEEWKLAIAALD